MIRKVFLGFFTLIVFFTYSQELQIKNHPNLSKLNKSLKNTSPALSGALSALCPGLGQLYAGKFWKVPIISGVFFWQFANFMFYNKEYKKFVTIFNDRRDGKRTDIYTIAGGSKFEYSDDVIKKSVDFYQKNKEIMIAYLSGIYLLNILDAIVGAHLKKFNIDTNLSLFPYTRKGSQKFILSVNYNL